MLGIYCSSSVGYLQLEQNEIHVVWGGDFNTVPCSPLYKFIKTGSFNDLALFKPNNWTGQYSALNVHTKMKSSVKRKLGIVGEEFDAEKHGKFLHQNEDPDYFVKLYQQVCSYKLTLEENLFILSAEKTPVQFQPLRLKSAYSEDTLALGWGKEGHAGEMEWSTLTVQEGHPLTVDYIL